MKIVFILVLLSATCKVYAAPVNLPRCGNDDFMKLSSNGGNSKWTKSSLTWSIRSYPYAGEISQDKTKEILREAFQAWTDHIPLSIKEVCSTCSADIVVDFVSRDHGDGTIFDGPGGILAHASLPEGGRIHFDYSETWDESLHTSNINFYLVAVHEIGHALGLYHSNNEESIMWRAYPPMDRSKVLPSTDIDSIQHLYGKKPTPTPGTPVKPQITTTLPTYTELCMLWDNTCLDKGEKLPMNSRLTSSNGKFHLDMQSDGNVVLYKRINEEGDRQPVWATRTHGLGSGPYHLVLQNDGNLVSYDGENVPRWSSGTHGRDDVTHLRLQDDGNLVLYISRIQIPSNAIWSSKTPGVR